MRRRIALLALGGIRRMPRRRIAPLIDVWREYSHRLRERMEKREAHEAYLLGRIRASALLITLRRRLVVTLRRVSAGRGLLLSLLRGIAPAVVRLRCHYGLALSKVGVDCSVFNDAKRC